MFNLQICACINKKQSFSNTKIAGIEKGMVIYMNLRRDGSEIFQYSYEGFSAYVKKGVLSHYPNYMSDSHWHPDIEFIIPVSGAMRYNINGTLITLNSGEGVFINSQQMHFAFSEDESECEYICVLLHPILLCTAPMIEQTCVTPILTDDSLSFVKLRPDIEWENQILSDVKEMYRIHELPTAGLHIQCLFFHLWSILFENAVKSHNDKKPSDTKLSILKEMIAYMKGNYAKKITLTDIAASGNVSKSTALVIFRKYINDTPMNYLIGYRINQGVKLLDTTNMPISEIALDVGFSGVSYFTETFRKHYGITPSVYKNRSHNKI